MGLLAAMRPLRYVHQHIQPRFRHKCCKNHTYYIIISCPHVRHNFCGPGNSNLNFDKIMFHAAERRHAGPFWARRRRLAKNEPACITALPGCFYSVHLSSAKSRYTWPHGSLTARRRQKRPWKTRKS